jgi:hypothetical protein
VGLSRAQGAVTGSGTAAADPIGTGFTYQGRLTEGGELVKGTCDFIFELYDQAGSGSPPKGGTLLGTEKKTDVALSEGLFTVELDFGAGAFAGGARWLQIEVDCGSGAVALSPRQALTPAPYALALPGMVTMENPYSPNVVGGYWGNVVGESVVGASIGGGGNKSAPNQVLEDYAAVGGGIGNTASGMDATVGGGEGNTASGGWSVVTGGWGNTASGFQAFVGGGISNTATYSYTAVSGGQGNTASAEHAAVGGGWYNRAEAQFSTIAGGWYNQASAPYATIAGGGPADPEKPDTTNNRVTDEYSTIGGGGNNRAGDGDKDTTTASYATISGGLYNIASKTSATVGGGEFNAASGIHATVGGGGGNTANAPGATVDGGYANTANDSYATVGGGSVNTANDSYATVGGGSDNNAGGMFLSAEFATIGGGEKNSAYSDHTTISGGYGNMTGGMALGAEFATIGGGESNHAADNYTTIGGGFQNAAWRELTTIPGGAEAVASNYGEMAYASGKFTDQGDAQTSMYVLRNTTTGAGSTVELFLDGVDQRLTLGTRTTVTFDILVVGRTEYGTSGGYHILGVIENLNGSTAFVGTPSVDILGEDDVTWDVWVEADDTNDALIIKVSTPKFGSPPVRWVATVRTVEVAW